MIPDDLVEQVRDAADLVGIIGESVPLKRTGSDFRGPCPFHGGTHNNFAVVPRKGAFYCFVCHEKGDVFGWFMKRQGLAYPDAVREVARRVGIAIPESRRAEGPDPLDPLRQAVAAAHDWFRAQLRERPDAAAARDYLARRGIDDEQATLLELGWAPPGGDFLAAMGALGIAPRVLVEAALVRRRDDGTLVPRFRHRVILPIHDLRGRVVAFGGRLLGPGEPKYLNSPEHPAYHKGGILYHLHVARHAIRKAGFAVLVEGYFDVLRLSMAGWDHVVAPLGTACTPEQARLVRRYTDQVVIAYDSDAAGLKATFRAADVLLAAGLRARVATLPDGEDPDTLVARQGLGAFAAVAGDAADVLERKLQLLERKGWLGDVAHRREALDRLLPTLRAASDPITRDLYVARVAERTGVGRETLAEEVARRAATPPPAPGAGGAAAPAPGGPPPWDGGAGGPGAPPHRPGPTRLGVEEHLLAVMLRDDGWLQRGLAEATPTQFAGGAARELFEALGRQRTRELPADVTVEAAELYARLREAGAGLADVAADETYVTSLQKLAVRPRLREVLALPDPVAKRRALEELAAAYPAARVPALYRWLVESERRRRARAR